MQGAVLFAALDDIARLEDDFVRGCGCDYLSSSQYMREACCSQHDPDNIMAATKELPDDRATLEYLRNFADRLLAVLEPVRQQVNYTAEFVADLLGEDFADADFFARTFAGLQQNVAGGIPPHQVLKDYLDLDGLVPPSQVPDQELQRLNQLVSSGTANTIERERHAILTGFKVAEYRDAIGAFVDRLHELQCRIIEKLATLATPPVSIASQPPPTGVVQEPDISPELGSRQQTVSSKQARKKTKGRGEQVPQPSAAFERWAIGLDENRCWQIFQRFGLKWRHERPLPGLPKNGRERSFLKAFVEKSGSITRTDLIKVIQPKFSDAEGTKIYHNIVKTTLSRLRARLRRELGLGNEADPIPWDDALNGHRMLIAIGYSVKDDQHRPEFRTNEELEA